MVLSAIIKKNLSDTYYYIFLTYFNRAKNDSKSDISDMSDSTVINHFNSKNFSLAQECREIGIYIYIIFINIRNKKKYFKLKLCGIEEDIIIEEFCKNIYIFKS